MRFNDALAATGIDLLDIDDKLYSAAADLHEAGNPAAAMSMITASHHPTPTPVNSYPPPAAPVTTPRAVEMDEQLSNWLAVNGFNPASMDEAQTKFAGDVHALAKRYAASNAHNPEKALKLELCAIEGLKANKPFAQIGLDMHRLDMTRGLMILTPRSGGQATSDVLAASMAMHYGLSESQAGKVFDQATMNAASEARHRDYTLHDLLGSLLTERRGERAPRRLSESDLRDALRIAAFEHQQQSMHASVGPSTGVQVPGILGAVANKSLLATWQALEVTWRSICRIASTSNFRQMTRYRLSGSGDFELVAPSGEIKHGGLTEDSTTNQLATYGKLIGISREDLINDDLSALVQIPSLLARMSAIKIEKSVYTALLGNAGSFFGSGNANILTGSLNILGLTGLGKAVALFRALVDANGNPIMTSPTTLLVPPALEATALALVTSTQVIASGASVDTEPNANIYAGRFKVVVAPYLGTTPALPSASNTGWYLLANSGDIAPVEVAFLDGRETPTIEFASFDFDRLGMATRAYHDFGVALAEPASAIWSDGLTAS